MQFWLVISMLPLSLLFFSYGAILAFPANIIAIPIMAWFIVPLLFLGCLSYFFLPLFAKAIFVFCQSILYFMMSYLNWLAKFDNLNINFLFLNTKQAALFIITVIAFILPVDKKIKVIAIFFLFPTLFPKLMRVDYGHCKAVVFDVGQGLAVLIKTKNHSLIYDTGPKWTAGSDAAKIAILPYLRMKGVKKIDKLVISHEDLDHRGGEDSIKNGVIVESVIRNKKNKAQLSCHQLPSWKWDGVNFEFIHVPINSKKENNRSCILKVSTEKNSLLLPGDIEREQEENLVLYAEKKLKANYLLVPHHGSKTSSTIDYIRAVLPKYVIYSSGFLNQYHFPHPSVVKRYQSVQTFNTAYCGMVTFDLREKYKKPRCYRTGYIDNLMNISGDPF